VNFHRKASLLAGERKRKGRRARF